VKTVEIAVETVAEVCVAAAVEIVLVAMMKFELGAFEYLLLVSKIRI
jgi:hypothetical protein